MAAGRRTSVDTSIGWRPWRVSHRPSFPAVVVLPEPWSPSSITTRGDFCVCDSPPCASPNSASISSRTMRTTCCDGREAAEHLLVHRPVAHAIDERLDDLEVDVRFEQRQADFPQRRLDVDLREASVTTN